MPKQIICIRHGEKTKQDRVHLSEAGVTRALHLAPYFANSVNPNINTPDVIIAMKQSGSHSSDRPRETVEPLAKRLNVNILTPFLRDEIDDVVDLIFQFQGKTVMVCWEHSAIAEIMQVVLNRYSEKKHHLNWSADPESPTDDGDDYGSIWVVDGGARTFRVYQEFHSITKPVFAMHL